MVNQKTVIVGGGMAGLAAAKVLQQAGTDWLLLDAGERLGGRVTSEQVDGFILDRGFQVLNNAYQTISELVDFRQLQLRSFIPGARVYGRGRAKLFVDPRRAPRLAWKLGPPTIPGAGDALLAMRLLNEAGRSARQDATPANNTAARDELQRRGFSPQFINWFIQPFFAGVFLDPELSTSWRCLLNQFRLFANGLACLPKTGMALIPELLARDLPARRIKLGCHAVKISPAEVQTANGESHEYDRLVLALDLPAYEKLVGKSSGRRMNGVSCCYFAAPQTPYREPLLSLAAADAPGPVATVAVLTNLQPAYSADGRALISVSVLGTPSGENLAADVIDQLEGWFGSEVRHWELIKQYAIPQALPEQTPPYIGLPVGPAKLGERIYLCGDHTTLPSIEGAAASGVRAAQAVLADNQHH